MNINDFLTDFKLQNPNIEGRTLHAISVHIGWLNWGSVGEESFNRLVEHFKAEKIAELERPGDFYNFVAYRDYSLTYVDTEGIRQTEFPNSKVFYVERKEPLSSLVLLYLLEPTQFGEVYVDKVITLLKKLNVDINILGCLQKYAEQSTLVNIHLCGLNTNESASSTPSRI